MIPSLRVGILFSMFATSGHLWAHSISQKLGGYQSQDGRRRGELQIDAGIDLKSQSTEISGSTLGITAGRKYYNDAADVNDKYRQEFYGDGLSVLNTLSVSYNDILKKLTERRLMVSHQFDQVSKTTNFSAGMSQWFWHESLQGAIDLSTVIADRPVMDVLDADLEILSPPPTKRGYGYTLSLKHLATPTTITKYALGQTFTNDRPVLQQLSLSVKQFITATSGAVHFDLTRLINRGDLGLTSTYGQVDAWIIEAAYLQQINKNNRARIAGRQYREDEVTRVQQDKYFMGSDMASMGLQHDFRTASKSNMSAELIFAWYKTNDLTDVGTQTVARTVEFSSTARF
jgi:hypothetical protein